MSVCEVVLVVNGFHTDRFSMDDYTMTLPSQNMNQLIINNACSKSIAE